MKPAATPHNPLLRLQRRLEAWRATPGRGRRIPEKLWQAAAKLARVHGLSATALALKLNYYDLQRRLGSAGAGEAEQAAQPQFVQLPAGHPHWPGSDPGTVELLQPSGTRLILRLPNISARQLLPLVKTLLRP